VSATAEAWGAARGAYEMGASSISDIARALDVSHQAVSKRRKSEGWREPGNGQPAVPLPLSAVATGPVEQVVADQARTPAQQIEWAQRAPTEAAAAGLAGAVVRQRLMAEMRDPSRALNAQGIRALAYAYDIFIGTAQLLTGGATEQIGVSLSPEDRNARIAFIFAQGRSRAIEATAADDGADDDTA
jgi:hypothetical protein